MHWLFLTLTSKDEFLIVTLLLDQYSQQNVTQHRPYAKMADCIKSSLTSIVQGKLFF